MKKMKPYHKYVFDEKERVFLGRFEEMYSQEEVENYDSWYQDTLTELDKKITLTILDQYNFNSVLDIGCGKGAFTHLLKKKNNSVLGVDISKTAIQRAKNNYPQIEFKVLHVNRSLKLKKKFDLVLIMETLSYIKDWRELLSSISKITKYLYISLFIPEEPIGYVKSMGDLSKVVQDHYSIVHKIIDEIGKRIFLFAQSKY